MNDFDNSEASSFNKNASIYNEARPGYPKEVYDTISKYIDYNEHSQLLEIGAGQGIATEEIFNRWKANITAIEPGLNLYSLMQHRFKNNPQISIVKTTFEEFSSANQYDGIFSATAFHWLDCKTKFERAHKLLRTNSFLFLYWNNYGITSLELEKQIKQIYTKYGFPESKESSDVIRDRKIESRKNEVIQSNVFNLIEHKIITTNMEYDSESYIKLLKTFPDHSEEKILNIETMFNEIRNIILERDNKIDVKVVINLEVAKKS